MTYSPDGVSPESRYGTQPYDPSRDLGTITEPQSYATLLRILLLSWGIYVLASIVMVIRAASSSWQQDYVSEMSQMYTDMGVPMANSELEPIAAAVPIMAGAGLVFVVALYLLVYLGMRARKNWARILGIIFAFIGTLGAASTVLFSLGAPAALGQGIIGSLLLVVWIAVNVYWLILAFNSRVAAFLRQQ